MVHMSGDVRAIVSIVIGLGAAILVLRRVAKRLAIARSGITTEGTVIELHKWSLRLDNCVPVVRFETTTGALVDATLRNALSRNPRVHVGDVIRIRYDPHRPNNAVACKGTLYGKAYWFGSWCCFTIVAVGFLYEAIAHFVVAFKG
jgi:uncharacterized protein DUF3592